MIRLYIMLEEYSRRKVQNCERNEEGMGNG